VSDTLFRSGVRSPSRGRAGLLPIVPGLDSRSRNRLDPLEKLLRTQRATTQGLSADRGDRLVIIWVGQPFGPILDDPRWRELRGAKGLGRQTAVRRGAGPAVHLRSGDDSCPDGVPFDVSHRRPKMSFVKSAGIVSCLPDMTRNSGAAVLSERVQPVRVVDGQSDGPDITGNDNEMHMICHQTVGPDGETVPHSIAVEELKVETPVVVRFEDVPPLVSPLSDMVGNSRYHRSKWSRQDDLLIPGVSLPVSFRCLFRICLFRIRYLPRKVSDTSCTCGSSGARDGPGLRAAKSAVTWSGNGIAAHGVASGRPRADPRYQVPSGFGYQVPS